MSSSYNIQWSATHLAQLSSERYAQFFALELHGELVFIGKGYREDLVHKIPVSIQQLDLDHLSLKIYLGRIKEIGLGRISSTLVETIVSMLVFAKKPRLNRDGKYRYAGMQDMDVTNLGFSKLPARIRAEKNLVIVGPQPARTFANSDLSLLS